MPRMRMLTPEMRLTRNRFWIARLGSQAVQLDGTRILCRTLRDAIGSVRLGSQNFRTHAFVIGASSS